MSGYRYRRATLPQSHQETWSLGDANNVPICGSCEDPIAMTVTCQFCYVYMCLDCTCGVRVNGVFRVVCELCSKGPL